MNSSHEQLNQLSDAQWALVPLRKFSPRRDEALPQRVIFWMAIVIATAVVLGKALVGLGIHGEIYPPRLASSFIAYWLVSYLCYSLTFARAWDTRARQLRMKHGSECADTAGIRPPG